MTSASRPPAARLTASRPLMSVHRRSLLTAALATSALAWGGCSRSSSSDAAAPGGADPVDAADGYPRTIDTADGPLTLTQQASAVACLSSDVADVMLALVGPERMQVVPRTCTQPFHSVHAEAARTVEHVIEVTGVSDPEQILGFAPDLVMLTTRHERESDARAQLGEAGVPMLSITNDWDSPEVFAENVTLLGEVLGAEDAATALVADHRRRWDAVAEPVADRPDSERPVVGMIRTLGDNLWMTGPGTIGDTAVTAAGARTLAGELGLDKGIKLDVEQLVKVDPDGLVLIDTTGQGKDQYADLLALPGVAELTAVREDHLVVVTSGELASGTGGIIALEKIAAALPEWQ